MSISVCYKWKAVANISNIYFNPVRALGGNHSSPQCPLEAALSLERGTEWKMEGRLHNRSGHFSAKKQF